MTRMWGRRDTFPEEAASVGSGEGVMRKLRHSGHMRFEEEEIPPVGRRGDVGQQ